MTTGEHASEGRSRAVAVAGYGAAVLALVASVWWFAWTSELEQAAERGGADLALAGDRLASQLQRFRELAVFLSDHPVLTPTVLRGEGAAGAEALLLGLADKTGSLDIALVAATGRIVAAASGARGGFVGAKPHVRRAMTGALGSWHGAEAETGQRVYSFAAPVFSPQGPPRGAVLVSVNMASIEGNWPADPSPVFFTDRQGVVFVANRTELLLTALDGDVARGEGGAAYREVTLRPFPEAEQRMVSGHDVWTSGADAFPARALHLTRPLPVIGLTAEILVDLAPSRTVAAYQAAFAGAVCLAFGSLLFLASERRRALAERLALEGRAKAGLEDRVRERTEALTDANARLRREIAERQEAEAQLRQAQADLVQAGKLSALGQMSAGISHELNQPLMAIRSFAENGAAFLDQGRIDTAQHNLGQISELARRMGRIIKNLRAFARQESEPITTVDLVGVVEAVLELADGRMRAAGVALEWTPRARPVPVQGGEVRLQQVVMNLVSNAIEAMEGAEVRRVSLEIVEAAEAVTLSVRDTGPGIADPGRIFDPFYSTKEVGRSEGMGLGLSISYGLVQGFGGSIRGVNAEGGGAVFTVDLVPSGLERAA